VSTDKGRSWRPFQEEPVIPMRMPGMRDPKVFYHDESQKWVLVVWCRADDNTEDRERTDGVYLFYNSDDLVHWELQSSVGPFFEVPDFFDICVEGTEEKHWVLVNCYGDFHIGDFDGKTFTQKHTTTGDYGKNYCATQTWNNMPDGRRVQMTWLRNATGEFDERYPDMPFDQQMGVICDLSLLKDEDGVLSMRRNPIGEITSLYDDSAESGAADIHIAAADTQRTLSMKQGGVTLLELANGEINAFGVSHKLSPAENIRVLVDRVSLEIFIADGERVMSFCYLPENDDRLQVDSDNEYTIHNLRSIWES
ncbi:MAG: hypothetical protein HRU15_19350, partial [Planctomycetes bacterium]|nr:hypothetical protein [Planctomycetota bacterium]